MQDPPQAALLRHQEQLLIDPGHPSLAGHFPGKPVVPGVLMLEHVLDAVERWLGVPHDVLRWPQVKFAQPLLPGQAATIELERQPGHGRVRFRVLREQALLASGELEIAA